MFWYPHYICICLDSYPDSSKIVIHVALIEWIVYVVVSFASLLIICINFPRYSSPPPYCGTKGQGYQDHMMLVVFWFCHRDSHSGFSFWIYFSKLGTGQLGFPAMILKTIYVFTKWIQDKFILINLIISYKNLNCKKNNLHTRLFIHASSIGIIISRLSLPFGF